MLKKIVLKANLVVFSRGLILITLIGGLHGCTHLVQDRGTENKTFGMVDRRTIRIQKE